MNWPYNKLWIGALSGLLVPFIGYALLLMLFEQMEAMGWLSDQGFSFNFRQRTTTILAVALNLIPLTIFRRRRASEAIRGLVLVTMLYAAVWFFLFGRALLYNN